MRKEPKREWYIQIRNGEWFIARPIWPGVIFKWGPFTRKEADIKAGELLTDEFLENEKRYYHLQLIWEHAQPCFWFKMIPQETIDRWNEDFWKCICHTVRNPMCRMFHPTIDYRAENYRLTFVGAEYFKQIGHYQ